MTSEQIEQMRRNEPMRFGYMVAEHVHGWRWVTPSYHCDPAHRHRWLVDPDDAKAEWYRIAESALPIDERSVGLNVPRYATDPAADYATLEHVRKTWDADGENAFYIRLMEIWNEKYLSGYLHLSDVRNVMRYEPGDYSAAALAVALAAPRPATGTEGR